MTEPTNTSAADLVAAFRDAYLTLASRWQTTEAVAAFRSADVALHASAGCLPEGWTDPRPHGGIVHAGPCTVLFARDRYASALAAEARSHSLAPVEDAGAREAMIAALG